MNKDDPNSHGVQDDDWTPADDERRRMPPLPESEPDEDTSDDSTEFPEDRPATHVYRHVACGGDAFLLVDPPFAGAVSATPRECLHCGAILLPKNMAWRHVHPLTEHDQRPAND